MNSKPVRALFARLFIIVVFAGFSSHVARAGEIFLLDQPVFTVATNGNASGSLYLLSGSNGTDESISNIWFKAGPLRSAVTSNQVAGTLLLASNVPFLKSDVGSREALNVSVTVTGLTEAGVVLANLYTNEQLFTTLRFERPQVPFSIFLENQPTNHPELVFNGGNPGILTLRNADAISYQLSWVLEINNRPFITNEVFLPAAGIRSLAVPYPKHSCFSSCWCPCLKKPSAEARLILHWVAGATNAIASPVEKVFALQARCEPSECGQWLRYIYIVILLALGGGASALANSGIPNQLRRLDLRAQLIALSVRVANLSTQLDSGLRVQMGMEARRLRNVLSEKFLFSPELPDLFRQINEGMAALGRQIEMAERMDALYDRIEDDFRIPPTLRNQLKLKLKKAGNLLEATTVPEDDLKVAQSYITAATGILENFGQPNNELAEDILRRAKELQTALPPGGPFPPKVLELPAKIVNLKSGGATQAADIPPASYLEYDLGLYRAAMIAEFSALPATVADAPNADDISRIREDWLRSINRDDPGGVEKARQLLEQLKQNVFPEKIVSDAEKAFPDKSLVRIDFNSPVAYFYQPVHMRAVFVDPRYNSPLVRELITCIWEFGDGLSEKGWSVSHYFAEGNKPVPTSGKNRFQVRIKLNSVDGKPVAEACLDLRKHKEQGSWKNNRTIVEALRFGIALMAALLVLVSGAEDKIAKLDCVAGCVAVIVMGFGADTIKNLVSQQKPQ